MLSSSTHACAFHIDTITLADGTYELVPEAKDPGEAQVNFADAVENPNPTPEASNQHLPSVNSRQAPEHVLSMLNLCNLLLFYLLAHLSL